MDNPSQPVKKDLVLIGGGHAHVSVIKRFAMRPIAGVRLTVISRDLLAPYSGMLPGYIAGHYSLAQCHIDLAPLVQFAGGRFIHDEVVGLDVDKQRIQCKSRPSLDYDVVSINIGSSPNMSSLDDNESAVIPVKPIGHFVERWHRLRERVLQQRGQLNIAVIGAGAGGVELTLAMQYRLLHDLKQQDQRQDQADLQLHFHLYDSNDEVLTSHNAKVRAYFHQLLLKRGIRLHLRQKITAFTQGQLKTESGGSFNMDEVLWVTNAGAQAWLRNTALVLTPEGFISVDPTLQTVSHPNVFAVGDIAQVIVYPRPKAGVFAVRQGLPLARNLRRALKNKCLRPFKPQSNFLTLISTGDKQAVASRAQWMLKGKLMWYWKNWIDRRFMDKFNRLPIMKGRERLYTEKKSPEQTQEQRLFNGPPMYCAGCGSKVSQSVLHAVLADLKVKSRPDIIQGLQHPDDAAVVRVDAKVLQVHTVDHFRAFINDPFLFGKISAEHALSDLYAMGAQPQTALAIATLNRQGEQQQQQDLRQLLVGAMQALDHGGAILIGGHTNSGDEMALGFAVNGTVEPEKVLHKTGLKPGDKLLLTKALGVGTIFAAYMRNKASGLWIDAALTNMQLSNRDAADIFYRHKASACTDVTGFGLIGHLREMIDADALTATLNLKSLPVLTGALDCLKMGIVSSAQEHNLQVQSILSNSKDFSTDVQYQLLFDPQTSGGLLAGIPAEKVNSCLLALHQAGYNDATIVGEVQASENNKAVVHLLENN